MKISLIPFFAVLLFCATLTAQNVGQVDKAVKNVMGTRTTVDVPAGPVTLARGIMALSNKLALKTDTDGNLLITNTTNNFTHKLVFPAPAADVTVTFPVGGGTVSTSPTTLSYQFTGSSFDTVLTQVEPTVGDTVITLPDTANVDVAIVLSTLTTNGLNVANSAWLASNSIVGEGTTADAFETTISFGDPTADQTFTLPNLAVNGAFVMSTLTTNNIDAANSIWFASNAEVLEGATADAFEITISPVDPTADATWSIPNFAVNAAFVGSTLTTNNIGAANSVWLASNSLVGEGTTADTSEVTVVFGEPTADRTVTLPDASGTARLFISEDVTATNVITANENGTTFYLNSATEFVSTLPAPAVGLEFTFIVAAAPATASYTIVADGSGAGNDIIKGQAHVTADAAGDAGTADDTITFVDGQAVAGDMVKVWSDGTSWFAHAFCAVAAGVTFTDAD
jgi:hypothetical protein